MQTAILRIFWGEEMKAFGIQPFFDFDTYVTAVSRIDSENNFRMKTMYS